MYFFFRGCCMYSRNAWAADSLCRHVSLCSAVHSLTPHTSRVPSERALRRASSPSFSMFPPAAARSGLRKGSRSTSPSLNSKGSPLMLMSASLALLFCSAKLSFSLTLFFLLSAAAFLRAASSSCYRRRSSSSSCIRRSRSASSSSIRCFRLASSSSSSFCLSSVDERWTLRKKSRLRRSSSSASWAALS